MSGAVPQTSISILDARLKLLSIPRSCLQTYMHAIVRCLVFRDKLSSHRRKDPFFHLSLNAVELSIFADADLIDEAFGRSISNDPDAEALETSEDIWIALQVEQHDDNAGGRVRDISAPLAAEGISILFLSTYISDFLLVKERRLELVTTILQREQFFTPEEVEVTSPPPHAHSSTTLSHARTFTQSLRGPSPSDAMAKRGTQLDAMSPTSMRSQSIDSGLSSRPPYARQITQSNLSNSRPTSALDNYANVSVTPIVTLSAGSTPESNGLPDLSASEDIDTAQSQPRSYELMQESILSESSTGSGIFDKIQLLPDELVCVGLSLAHEKHWRTKIVHALYYPHDVMPRPGDNRRRVRRRPRSSTHTSTESDDVTSDQDYLDNDNSDNEAVEEPGDSKITISGLTLDDGEHPYSATPKPKHPSLSRLALKRTATTSSQSSAGSPMVVRRTKEAPYPIPFLSLTLTVEGGSLIADIRLMRALFDEQEESMVFASGQGGLVELWAGEDDNFDDDDMASPTRERYTRVGDTPKDASDEWEKVDQEEESQDDAETEGRSLYKCLQLDLSSFGLEKAGLAHQFAGLLTKEDINLLYSSTYRTANILVAKKHIRKARRALEANSK